MEYKTKPSVRSVLRRGRRPLLMLFMVAVLLVSAASSSWAIELDKDCSVTVTIPTDQSFAEDMAEADLVVDVYQLAGAAAVPGYDTYGFQIMDPYTGRIEVSEEMDKDAQIALTQTAAKIALEEGTPIATDRAIGEAITTTDGGNTIKPGLYLLITHGKGLEKDEYVEHNGEGEEEKITTIGYSTNFIYHMEPQIVSLPTKDAIEGEDGEIIVKTSNPGEWKYDLTVTLKPEQSPRYGDLRIVKTLNSYVVNEEATFVFLVEATKPGETEPFYSEVFGLTFSEAGQEAALATRIPAGSLITVTEIYSGSTYELVSEPTQTTTIVAGDVVEVFFTNDYTPTPNGGHGIVNNFSYDADSGEWVWRQLESNTGE